MQCDKIRNYFADYLTERLTAVEQSVLSRHLEECSACSAELQEWTDIWVKMASLPSLETVDAAPPQLSPRLRQALAKHKLAGPAVRRSRFRLKDLPRLMLVAAAVLLMAVVTGAILYRQATPAAAATVAEGSLDRTRGGQTDSLKAGDTIERAETVRTVGGEGAVLALVDGSRVEIREHSELNLVRLEGSVQIRLSQGALIVNAARQQRERSLVHTKDVTVSAQGAVFMVEAWALGTRVAVIEGQVQIQHGATAKILLPGEQIATSPATPVLTVAEQISWSRNAAIHLALLQQSLPSLPATPTARSSEFAAATIRAFAPGTTFPDARAGAACRGIDGSDRMIFALRQDMDPVVEAPRGRCVIVGLHLQHLVRFAYGMRSGRVSGGPAWASQPDTVQSTPEGTVHGARHVFQIEATADDSAAATTEQLKQMLQNLLADRLQLKVRHETQQVPGFALVVQGSGLKIAETSGSPESPIQVFNEKGQMVIRGKSTLAQLASMLNVGFPVIDKTGLTGVYEYEFVPPPPRNPGALPAKLDAWLRALQAQLGLGLEGESAVPTPAIVIEHAELPSPN